MEVSFSNHFSMHTDYQNLLNNSSLASSNDGNDLAGKSRFQVKMVQKTV